MATDTAGPVVSERGPPAQWLFHRVVNPLMKLLLRSPVHGIVSDSLTLITFTGRRSGREYTTPVGYHQVDDGLVVFTHSNWWKNLRGGAEVRLLLRGERRVALAEPVEDPEAVADYVLAFIDRHGLDAAQRLGLEFEGDTVPSRAALIDGVESTVVIELSLQGNEDE